MTEGLPMNEVLCIVENVLPWDTVYPPAALASWSIVITCIFFSRIRTVIKLPLATSTIPSYLDSFKWQFNYLYDYETALSLISPIIYRHLWFHQHHRLIVSPAGDSGERCQGRGTQLDSSKVAMCVMQPEKHAPFVLTQTLWSQRESLEMTAAFRAAYLQVWRRRICDWGREGLSRHGGPKPGNGFWGPLGEEAMTESSQQGAEVRSMRQEAKWVSLEGRHVKPWRNVIFCSFFLHHQMPISHPAGLVFIIF